MTYKVTILRLPFFLVILFTPPKEYAQHTQRGPIVFTYVLIVGQERYKTVSKSQYYGDLFSFGNVSYLEGWMVWVDRVRKMSFNFFYILRCIKHQIFILYINIYIQNLCAQIVIWVLNCGQVGGIRMQKFKNTLQVDFFFILLKVDLQISQSLRGLLTKNSIFLILSGSNHFQRDFICEIEEDYNLFCVFNF